MEVLVTNNAKDTTPVWEDATADVKNGANHVFTNKTAANGFAFNFKLSVERGASDTGGYISNIGVLQTKVNRKNEKSPAKFTRPKMGITKQAGEKSHRQPG